MLVGVGPDSTPLASQGPPPLAGHRPPCPERGLGTWDGDAGPALPLPKTLGAVTPRGFCRAGGARRVIPRRVFGRFGLCSRVFLFKQRHNLAGTLSFVHTKPL